MNKISIPAICRFQNSLTEMNSNGNQRLSLKSSERMRGHCNNESIGLRWWSWSVYSSLCSELHWFLTSFTIILPEKAGSIWTWTYTFWVYFCQLNDPSKMVISVVVYESDIYRLPDFLFVCLFFWNQEIVRNLISSNLNSWNQSSSIII